MSDVVAFLGGQSLPPVVASGAPGPPGPDTSDVLASLAASGGAALVGFLDNGTGAAATTVRDFLRQINHKPSGHFYSEAGAKIQRLRDRVFIGDAAVHNGTNVGSQPDWLTTKLIAYGRTFGFQHNAQLAVLSDGLNPAGANAIVGGARTSPLTAVGGVVGVLGVAVNNNTTYACGSWGLYGEVYQDAASIGGVGYAAELNPINFKAAASSDPYQQHANQVGGLQIAAGGEYVSGLFPASFAGAIRNNGTTFDIGWIFGHNALTGTTGNGTGTAIAIAMACGHMLKWFGPSAVSTSQILSTATTTNNSTTMNFAEGAVQMTNGGSGKPLLQLVSGNTRVNFLNLIPGAAGEPIQVAAAGDDPNIGVLWTPKGNEKVWFGTFTANADAPVTGYIAIKDSTGNQRKLAVIA